MSDLLLTFQRRRSVIKTHLRFVREAKADVARWPQLSGPKSHLAWCEHGLAEVMHRYCGHPKPAPYVPTITPQAAYIESVMSIPLPTRKVA